MAVSALVSSAANRPAAVAGRTGACVVAVGAVVVVATVVEERVAAASGRELGAPGGGAAGLGRQPEQAASSTPAATRPTSRDTIPSYPRRNPLARQLGSTRRGA